ncbi:MAG TPA: hypothetical protein VK438_17170 [Xanthobacteraceae bacterium]|nr:hypothetical protein [Xanthobacteraceae bacterium]
MSEPVETPTAAPASPSLLGGFILDSWAVALSVLFIALIVAGIFPRVPW